MILPTKHIRLDRSLLGLGAELLPLLDNDRTVSSLWDAFSKQRQRVGTSSITFDWFILGVDFLFTAGTIELHDGRLRRAKP